MNKLKNYLLATACLVILVAALTLMGGPLVQQGQAVPPTQNVTVVNTTENPVPVVVENGDMDGTMVVTLAEGLEFVGAQSFELDPLEVGDFRFVSFLGNRSIDDGVMLLEFAFSTEPGARFSDAVPKLTLGQCSIRKTGGANQGVTDCRIASTNTDGVHRVAGPFLMVRLTNDSGSPMITLKAFLKR